MLLVLAALAGAATVVPTYLVVGGEELSPVDDLASALVVLLVPVAHLAVGAVLLRGRSRSSAWPTRAWPEPWGSVSS
ncbi:hypothetical protein [Blastococcus brunescens]|uniref:Uncharacterized protein n=1 Tax=Blastococcus brunescens TaxID=1564165 RepID=A0ABZ1AWR3_9ACTN|nr:hypothetical protein [Blastococcus sp. BMG 8361]WRL63013.1 hypothetical protein U6N30_24665 [Blastococcus sp. BMG 8361]